MNQLSTIGLAALLALAATPLASAGALVGRSVSDECPDPIVDWVVCQILDNDLVDKALEETGDAYDTVREYCHENLWSGCTAVIYTKAHAFPVPPSA